MTTVAVQVRNSDGTEHRFHAPVYLKSVTKSPAEQLREGWLSWTSSSSLGTDADEDWQVDRWRLSQRRGHPACLAVRVSSRDDASRWALLIAKVPVGLVAYQGGSLLVPVVVHAPPPRGEGVVISWEHEG